MKIVKRPWGYFNQFVKNKKCTVKILEIMPKQELSLQYHKKRKEMWYFLTDGYVQLGLEKRKVKKGDKPKHKRTCTFRENAETGCCDCDECR